jgi:hypothetical protein
MAAALAVARLMPIRRRWRLAFCAAVVAGMAIDGLTEAIPAVLPPPRVILPGPADSVVIELPTDDVEVNAAAMYRQLFHRRPVVNGYTGHVAPHYAVLSYALARGDTSVLTGIARQHPLVVIVNSRADRGGDFERMIETIPGIRREGISAAGPVFLLPRQPPAPAAIAGTVLPFRGASFDAQTLQVDLGDIRPLGAIHFDMRNRFRDLGERLRIDGSADGTTWRELWLGWTGEYALDATLRDPRAVTVRIAVADGRARYLRIYPSPAWLQEELRVVGRD